MSHSGASLSAMQVMIVVMVMALLTTTSHCINISGSIVSGGGYSSSSRCNGLTGTACRIAYSELDFDLEFMLDSEFSIRFLGSLSISDKSKERERAASCGTGRGSGPCRGNPNQNLEGENCDREPTNRGCHRYGSSTSG